MADGAVVDGSAPAGLWRAFRDTDTQRVFWEDQQSGAVSWYVAPPDPATLAVRSYREAGKNASDRNNGKERSVPSPTSDVEPSSSSLGASPNDASMRLVSTATASPASGAGNVETNSRLAVARPKSTSAMARMPVCDPAFLSAASAPHILKSMSERPRAVSDETSSSSSSPSSSSSSAVGSSSPQPPSAAGPDDTDEPGCEGAEPERLRNLLVAGVEMNKHRSRGAARRRYIVFSNNWDRIMWAKSRRDFLMGNVLGRIMVKDIVEVREGFDRSLFRANFDKPEQGQCCFTLQASHRTLNLETDLIEQRTDWVTALHYIISNYQLDLAETHWGDILEGVPEVDEEGMEADEGVTDTTVRPTEGSDSQGNKLLRTMTFWKWGSRDARSGSDSTSSTTSQDPSSRSGRAPGLDRPRSLRQAWSTSHSMGTHKHTKGPLLAMEERYNALLKQVVEYRRQIEILGVACGRTADMLWESGARDVTPDVNALRAGGGAKVGQQNADTPSESFSWIDSFRGDAEVGDWDTDESLRETMATWTGPGNPLGNISNGMNITGIGQPPLFSGPLHGKIPKTMDDVQRLAVVMMRMADNLVRGRGISFGLSDDFNEGHRDDEIGAEGLPREDGQNDSDVLATGSIGTSSQEERNTNTTARSSRASTFQHSATIFESLRKAILNKMEHDDEKDRMKAELEASREELARLRQHGDNFDRLAKIVALLPSMTGGPSRGSEGVRGGGKTSGQEGVRNIDARKRRRSLILDAVAPTHNTAASGSLDGSRVASRIEAWLSGLTPELSLSFGDAGRDEHKGIDSRESLTESVHKTPSSDDGSLVRRTDIAGTRVEQSDVKSLLPNNDAVVLDGPRLNIRERRQSKRSRRSSHLRKGSLVYNFHESDGEAMLRGLPERSETPSSTLTSGSFMSLEGSDTVEETELQDANATMVISAARPKSLPPPPPTRKARRASKRPPKPPPMTSKRRSKTMN